MTGKLHPEDEKLRKSTDCDVLDLEHLRQYTFGDDELENELISLFRLQIIQQLNAINNVSDPDEWKLAIHTLKGSARGVGAHEIARICAELEKSGPGADLTDLKVACKRCLEEIAIYIKS